MRNILPFSPARSCHQMCEGFDTWRNGTVLCTPPVPSLYKFGLAFSIYGVEGLGSGFSVVVVRFLFVFAVSLCSQAVTVLWFFWRHTALCTLFTYRPRRSTNLSLYNLSYLRMLWILSYSKFVCLLSSFSLCNYFTCLSWFPHSLLTWILLWLGHQY